MENELLFTDRKAFRDWLTENHNTGNGIWLVFVKGGEKLKTLTAENKKPM